MHLSTPARVNAAALVVTAAGIVLQIASGSELYAAIPPGPIILLVGAGLVVFGPRRLSPIVGVVVPLVLVVGGTIASIAGNPFLDQLTEPGELGVFTGTLIQLLGLGVALVSGITAVTRAPPPSRGLRSTSDHGRRG